METIKEIKNVSDMKDSLDHYYYGWSNNELKALKDISNEQYQTKFYGEKAIFEVMSNEGEFYYAFFKPGEVFYKDVGAHFRGRTVYHGKALDYLLLQDDCNVIINAYGNLYRFSIDKKQILESSVIYNDISSHNFTGVSSHFHSISSEKYQIMVIIDDKGIVAINWDGILWRHYFDFDCTTEGSLNLISIEDNHVKVEDTNPRYVRRREVINFDILTGDRI